MSAFFPEHGFRANSPFVARLSAVLAGLGYAVGLVTSLGLWSPSQFAKASFTTAHLCLMACFLWFWLRGIRYWWVRLRSRQMLDPFSLSRGVRPFLVRLTLQGLGVAYFVWAVASADRATAEWDADTVRAQAAGWAMLGTIVATSLGSLERRIAAYQEAATLNAPRSDA